MRVLLTGAGGFIGQAIGDQLRARGDEVVGVDAFIPQAHRSEPESSEGMHRLDVRESADWVDLLRGVDVVCHQAAMVGAGVTVADLPLYAAHNDLGTAALLAAMGEAAVGNLVLASSMVVYGEGRYRCPTHDLQAPGPRPLEALRAGRFDNGCPCCGKVLEWELVSEDAALDPRSSYAVSKLAQEHYSSAWARQAGGKAIALRYHNVYGPHMPQDTPYSGVAAIFRSSLERGEPPRVFEDGGQMRDFVHVADVARANVLSIDAAAGRGTGSLAAYNVCSGRPVSIREVAAYVADGAEVPVEPTVTGEFRSGDVRHIVAAHARAEAELGFRAEIAPEVGLAQFATAPLRATTSS